MKTIRNWNYGSTWYTFYSGAGPYRGEAYSQTGYPQNDQANWAEFTGYVYHTSGGNTWYGNDCSGFVSISWKLPTRYDTTAFESDATNSEGYVTKLGAIGSGKIVPLSRGDALVKGGSHIILFESYLPDGMGINVIEQTSIPSKGIYWALRSKWTWSQLSNYRPIRRNNLTEDSYVFATKWGSQGDLNGQFNYPRGVAVDSSGNVFVADEVNTRIQKFNSAGDFITKWGTHGCGIGQFMWLEGLASDKFGNIFTVEGQSLCPLSRERVQKFTNNGSFISKWGSCCSPDGYFHYPAGVAVDPSGSIYVADQYNHRIQKFDNNGKFITKFGFNGTGDGQFQYPDGIAADSSGNVYVADTYNHRIQKFSLVSPEPSAPTNLAADRASTTSIKLTWKDNSNNETGFKIIRKPTYMGLYETIATLGPNVTSYTDTGLVYAMQYFYAVSAFNNNGEAAYSNEALGGTY